MRRIITYRAVMGVSKVSIPKQHRLSITRRTCRPVSWRRLMSQG
jgi:hypothetical protein